METIKKLWEVYTKLHYPSEGHVEELDLELLDGDIAGCITTFIKNNGQLDSERIRILKNCLSELEADIEKTPETAHTHFFKLLRIGKLVLRELKMEEKVQPLTTIEYRVPIPPYFNYSDKEERFWVLKGDTRVSKGDKKNHTFDLDKYEIKYFVHSVPKFSLNLLKDGKTLSKYMKKRLAAPGYFYTICPKNYLYDDLQILTESILWKKPQYSYLDILTMFSAEIYKFLKEDMNNICIIEKRVSQDNGNKENINKYFSYKNENYVILSNSDSEKDITKALEEHTNQDGAGVMVLGNIKWVKEYLLNGQITDEKFFDELTKYSFRLYYPIYDNESFMVWETPSPIRLFSRLHIKPSDIDTIEKRHMEYYCGEANTMPLPDIVIIEKDIKHDPGYMLYRYTKEEVFAGDTWHVDLHQAKSQAEFEYGETLGNWQEIPKDVKASLKYVIDINKKN